MTGNIVKRRFCESCIPLRATIGKGFLSRTKADLFAKCRSWQSARAKIQKHARQTYIASGRPMICGICGYSEHVEICHIREVADFSPEAKLREVNAPLNLAALCPNHHWEFDHGLLLLT